MNNRAQWYDIPISARLPSVWYHYYTPLTSQSKDLDLAWPSDDLPLGPKNTPMTPPISPYLEGVILSTR